MKKKPPNSQWIVTLLGIFKPEDEIFEKSFKYVKPMKDVPVEAMLDNKDGFFQNLPALPEHLIRKQNRLRLPKKLRNDLKWAKL